MKGGYRMKKIHLIKIYAGILALCMAMANLTSCIDDDLVKNSSNVEEGVPVTISLNFAAIPSTDVSITRATGSDLSELSDVVICVFHGDGSFEQMVTNYNSTSLTLGASTIGSNGENRYEVSFESTSGEKNLIALANVADGAYWDNLITELTAAYTNKTNFDGVKAIVANLNQKLVDQAGTTDGMQPFHITSSSQMFISGWNEGVVFGTNNTVTAYGTYGDKDYSVAVKMKRAMAHITFKITASPTNAGTFTPSSFRVYNIPTKSYLTNDLQGTDSYALTTGVTDVKYIYTAAENIGTAQGGYYSFNFYMPENVQDPGTSSDYNSREAWNGESGASPEEKTWTNAPQNSTFVVISGTYEGTATVGEGTSSVTANVEYTIHLGDFGESSDDARDYGDFSVMRNYSYTYTVNVLGVDNIIVEAQKTGGEEYQNGAEGSIYDSGSTKYSYNLDAHYEQVYLEYNLSDIANSLGQGLTDQDLDDAIANQLILIIQSEAMDYTHEATDDEPYTTRNKRGTLSPYKIYADAVRNGTDAAKAKADVLGGDGEGNNPTKGFDYKWIEFLPQTGTTLSSYPGISSWAMEDLTGLENSDFYEGATGTSSMLDVYDVIVEMGKAIKNIYLNGSATSDKIKISQSDGSYVARFTAFVNENYYLHHPLTGATIDTWSVMVNKIPREMIIAMSTETSTDGNSSYSKIHSYISQLSMETFYNDRVTSLNAFGIETYNETPLDFDLTYSGSDENLTDNDGRENQKILIGASSTPNWSTYITAGKNGWTSSVGTVHSTHKLTGAYATKAAYSACMSRNRDLNGNGQIDENEIRWFLASLNEYIRMGIGANALSSAAQLYIGSKADMTYYGYPSSYVEDGSLFYTSSASEMRVYWAIEKGSYGYYYSEYGDLPIRCIRNLPATSGDRDISSIDEVLSDATFVKHDASDNEPIVLEFKDRLVSSLYRQRVSGALSKHNEDDDANSFYDGIFVAANDLETTYALRILNGYTSLTNPCATYSEGNYNGNWRLPNLVELSAMNAAGIFKGGSYAYANNLQVASCTLFSNTDVRVGFAYNGVVTCPSYNALDWGFKIRCVRDVPTGYFD